MISLDMFGLSKTDTPDMNMKNNIFEGRSIQTQMFENKFASILNVKYALGVSSGFVALHLALLSCGIKAGDEVLVDPLFKYGAFATVQCNAIPVFYDVSTENFMPNVDDILNKISVKTKAIVITNVFGCTPDLKGIRALCDKMGIYLIEDCAQTLMCKHNDRYAGTYGDIGIFSFRFTHYFSLDSGGVLVTNNEHIYRKAFFMHDESVEMYLNSDDKLIMRYSYRMPELVSNVALSKLGFLESVVLYHKTIGKYIKEMLNAVNLKVQDNMYGEHVYWKAGVLIDNQKLYYRLENKLQGNELVEFGLNNKKVVPELEWFRYSKREDVFCCPYDCIFAGEKSKKESEVVNAKKIVNSILSIKIKYDLSIHFYEKIINTILEELNG